MYENNPETTGEITEYTPEEKIENQEKSKEENKGTKTPSTPKKTRKFSPRVRYCALAVCIACGSFLGGFFTREWTLDPQLRSLRKIKNHIQKHYY